MKKIALLLFATVFLSSCNLSMGDTEERHWKVCKIQSNGNRNSNKAIYTVASFDSDGYRYNGFKFEDQYGKFQVGDAVELVKFKY